MSDRERIFHHEVQGLQREAFAAKIRETTSRYGALLRADYPPPGHRGRLSEESRAAQFAPFAALTGYDEAVEETARRVEAAEDDR